MNLLVRKRSPKNLLVEAGALVRRRQASQSLLVNAGLVAAGAVAIGALAIGTIAVARLAIAKLSIARAQVRDLAIDNLNVGRLTVLAKEGEVYNPYEPDLTEGL